MPIAKSFGALDLGTWVHGALQTWYAPATAKRAIRRWGKPSDHFETIALSDIDRAKKGGAHDIVIEKAMPLVALGIEMMKAYEQQYGNDSDVEVIGAEIPLEFTFSDDDGKVIGVHRLKPDLIWRHRVTRGIRLMENKTAREIRTEHLTIDDQARPYGAMTEKALRNAGLIQPEDKFEGVMYNIIKKVLPDDRETNAKGQYLNKDGSISKRQPGPQFERKLLRLSRRNKILALRRLRSEVVQITLVADMVRKREIDPFLIPKTPHMSCPRFCEFFKMCETEEEGGDIRGMRESMFITRDPYVYAEDKVEPVSFEFG